MVALNVLGEVLKGHAPGPRLPQRARLIGPPRLPDDRRAAGREVLGEDAEDVVLFCPHVVQRSVHRDEVHGFIHREVMQVALLEAEAVVQPVSARHLEGLPDVLFEPVQSYAAKAWAALSQRAQVPAIAAAQVHRQTRLVIDLAKGRHGIDDLLLKDRPKGALQHRSKPRQHGLSLSQHLLARALTGAHQTRRALRHVRAQHGLHGHRHEGAGGLWPELPTEFGEHKGLGLTVDQLKSIGGIAPSGHIARVGAGGIRELRGGQSRLRLKGVEEPVDDAYVGDVQRHGSLHLLLHAALLMALKPQIQSHTRFMVDGGPAWLLAIRMACARSALTLTLLLATGCATADLRPDSGAFDAHAERQGKAWLLKASQAQGGAQLMQHRTLSFWLQDVWPSWFYRAVAMPWPENEQPMRLDVRVGTDDARLTFLGGPKDKEAWGIQQWVTYRAAADGKLDFDEVHDPDEDIKFWLPTTLYFPLLAWRIQEADHVRLMSPETIAGKSYQRVFVSWGKAEPQDEVDQYIIYIDSETHLVRWARYTVRDFADFAVGLMRYEDYRQVGDLKLPFSMRVVSDYDSPDTGLHRFIIERVELDADLPEGHIVPRPELSAGK